MSFAKSDASTLRLTLGVFLLGQTAAAERLQQGDSFLRTQEWLILITTSRAQPGNLPSSGNTHLVRHRR